MTPLLTSTVIGAPVGLTICDAAQTSGAATVAQAMAQASAKLRRREERRFMLLTVLWQGFCVAAAHQLALVGLREIEGFRIGAAARQLDLVRVVAAGVMRLQAEIGHLVVPADRGLHGLALGVGGPRLLVARGDRAQG